jgi:methyl-accepting chemotaxis protein
VKFYTTADIEAIKTAYKKFYSLSSSLDKLKAQAKGKASEAQVEEFSALVTEYKNSMNGMIASTGKRNKLTREELDVVGPKMTDLVAQSVQSFVETQNVLGPKISAEAEGIVTKAVSIFSAAMFISVLITFFLRNGAVSLNNKIMTIIGGLRSATSEVSRASGEISNMSGSVATEVTNQASSIQETSATMTQLGSMTESNLKSAEEVAQLARYGNDAAQEGMKTIKDVNNAISSMSNSSEKLIDQSVQNEKQFEEVNKIIGSISEKVKVINEIVFQTKLLSFNASVEAARAGEHGKGFAVVAEEIANLADMSGSASGEIFNLISESTSKVTEIVNHTKVRISELQSESKEATENGQKFGAVCERSFNDIYQRVSEINQFVSGIVEGSNEQNHGITEVNQTIQGLSEATQSNALSAQETKSEAEGLLARVEDLNGIVGELEHIVSNDKSSAPEVDESDFDEHDEPVGFAA